MRGGAAIAIRRPRAATGLRPVRVTTRGDASGKCRMTIFVTIPEYDVPFNPHQKKEVGYKIPCDKMGKCAKSGKEAERKEFSGRLITLKVGFQFACA